MATSERNIAVIGCGYWGKNLVRNFHELGVLACIHDPSPEQAKTIAEQYKVEALSFEDIIQNSKIDGVAIAAPAILHAELCQKAIAAGKDVFVEKPIALTMDSAKKLQTLAEENNRILMVGHLLQYHPVYRRMAEIVSEGAIGKIKYVQSNRMSFGKVRNEEDVLWSFAPHDISMILGLCSDNVKSITATGQTVHGENHADIATLEIEFENDIKSQINVNWLSPYKQQKLTVIGTKGMLVFDDTLPWEEKLVLTEYEADKEKSPPVAVKKDAQAITVGFAEPLKQECLHFLECIEQRITPRTNSVEAINVLKILTEAEKQLKRKHKSMSEKSDIFVHETSYVDDGADIGKGAKIWHFSHILPQTKIGESVVIGQNCMIGPDVTVGNRCKIQNNVSLYKGVTLEDDVFCGPSCVFTNVNNPRAAIERKNEFRTTNVRKGTTIGANATIVCGHELGEYSFIAAGAVVTNDVPNHAMMAGVPAKQIGWMSHAGAKLGDDLVCPIEGRRYRKAQNGLEEILETSKKSA